MQRARLIAVLALLWFLAAGWAVWSATGMAPSGDGLVRGFNKVVGLLGGWALSALFSFGLLIVTSRGGLSPGMRWLARGPAILSLIAALAVSAAVWKSRGEARGTPPAPTRPVTESAPAVKP